MTIFKLHTRQTALIRMCRNGGEVVTWSGQRNIFSGQGSSSKLSVSLVNFNRLNFHIVQMFCRVLMQPLSREN